MLFEKLRKIRAYEREAMPGIESMEDHDIVLAIGAAQEQRQSLIFKQLMLQGLGASATLRRRLLRLIRLGYIQKRQIDDDGRLTAYVLNPEWASGLARLNAGLIEVARDILMEEGSMRKAHAAIISNTRNCSEVLDILRPMLEAHGKVGQVQISCSSTEPNTLLTMIELAGNARTAAAEIGGHVFGSDLIFASWVTPDCFQCAGTPPGAACAGRGDVA